jgi:hypothetical protein
MNDTPSPDTDNRYDPISDLPPLERIAIALERIADTLEDIPVGNYGLIVETSG